MKNLKKVLAMVLAFACTFSMFAGAKVFEDVPAGSDYSEAITMLSDLGVIQGKDDGKYHPEDTITRAEACAMIARLMTGDPNVSQYVGAQSFTDVAKGSWKDSAIGYCYINGIVIGVGNNKFEPDRAITDAEFVTMVVRAMGYETADMKQNYPFSYMSNAQAIGLLDGTNMVASTDALRGEDAQVIYNALFTDYARGAKLVNTTHGTSVESYPTLAESVWGLNRAAAGTWKNNSDGDKTATLEYCKAHTWVVLGADPENEGNIIAYPISDNDGDIYVTDKDRVAYSFKYDGDASAVAGYQVELWGEGSHGEPEWDNKADKYVWSEDWTIKAIKTVKGQTAYDYNASMADSKSDNGEIVLGEETLDLDAVADNKKYAQQYAVDQYVANEYNGYEMDSAKNVEKALNVRDGAQYKLMDWDSDGDIDWVVVSSANYYKVENVNSKRATVVSMVDDGDFEYQTKSTSEVWELDGLTDTDNSKIKYDYKAEDLKEGDIVEVTYTVAYDKSEKAQVVTATVSKVEAETKSLDKVSTKDGLTLTFDDEEIKVAENNAVGDTIVPANPRIYREFNGEELGTEFALYMNRNGFIVYSDYATETSNYAMVLDTANGNDRAGDRELAKVDLLLADNSVAKDVELTSGARIQDNNGDDNDDAYSDREFKEELVVGNVYKYWMNEDGQITRMQAMFNDATQNDKDLFEADTKRKYNDSYSYNADTDRLQDSANQYVASLEEADVIFAVATNGNYIQIDSDDTDNGLYVDSGDVMAVKYDQIPDIGKNEETTPEVLDTEEGWLNSKAVTENEAAEFVVSANGNKAGMAALIGVNNFSKFDAAATKIGLVTDVAYVNSSDGKYVEVEVATNGKVGTLESKKKVDFDDIVEVEGATVKSESTVIDTGVFHKDNGDAIALDKYLQDNAAYAEITTDADGNVTKVNFLNTADGEDETNELKGDYYTVERRVVTENKSKSFDYVNTTARYAAEKKLHSVDRMPIANVGIADEATYYTISARPTRADEDYSDLALLTVAAGFDGTPKIEAATKDDMNTASIDNRYTSDTYYVADIAFNGDGKIAAMFNFTDYMAETDAEAGVVEAKGVTYNIKDEVADYIFNWEEIGANVVDAKIVDNGTGATLKETGANLEKEIVQNYVTVRVPDTAKSGTATLVLTDDNGKEWKVDITLEYAAAKTMKVTELHPKRTALTQARGVGAATITDASGNAIVDNTDDMTITVTGVPNGGDVSDVRVALSNADKKTINFGTSETTLAGEYTVEVAVKGYKTASFKVNVEKADASAATLTNGTAGNVGMELAATGLTGDALKASGLKPENFTVTYVQEDDLTQTEYKAVVKSVSVDDANQKLNIMLETPMAKGHDYAVKVVVSGTDNLEGFTVTGTVKVS